MVLMESKDLGGFHVLFVCLTKTHVELACSLDTLRLGLRPGELNLCLPIFLTYSVLKGCGTSIHENNLGLDHIHPWVT